MCVLMIIGIRTLNINKKTKQRNEYRNKKIR